EGLDEVELELLEEPRVENAKAVLSDFSDEVQFLLVGENHLDSTPKQVLKHSLEILKSKGFEYLGLEMLNRSAQSEATAYCTGQISDDEFSDVWRENWAYGAQRQNYLEVVKRACDLGFKLIALDIRDEQNIREPEYDRMDERNMVMAIEAFEAAKESKVVILTGALHAVTKPMVNINSDHYHQMTRTSIVSELSRLYGDVGIESVLVGSRLMLIDDHRICLVQSVMGYFKEHGPAAPAARVIYDSEYFHFNKVLLQAVPQKPVDL
ncbi:MAG: ChaN family lipoprotein, partial [Pseudomonadota bacterium]